MITIFANIIFMKNNIFLNRVYYRCKIVSFYKYYKCGFGISPRQISIK